MVVAVWELKERDDQVLPNLIEVVATGVHPNDVASVILPCAEAGAFRLSGDRDITSHYKFVRWYFHLSGGIPKTTEYASLVLFSNSEKGGIRVPLSPVQEAWFDKLDSAQHGALDKTDAVDPASPENGMWSNPAPPSAFARLGRINWHRLADSAVYDNDAKRILKAALDSDSQTLPSHSKAAEMILSAIRTLHSKSADTSWPIEPSEIMTTSQIKAHLDAGQKGSKSKKPQIPHSVFSRSLKELGFDWLPKGKSWEATKRKSFTSEK
jgi:hypothetical protein